MFFRAIAFGLLILASATAQPPDPANTAVWVGSQSTFTLPAPPADGQFGFIDSSLQACTAPAK
jgi:hypothetical protein